VEYIGAGELVRQEDQMALKTKTLSRLPTVGRREAKDLHFRSQGSKREAREGGTRRNGFGRMVPPNRSRSTDLATLSEIQSGAEKRTIEKGG